MLCEFRRGWDGPGDADAIFGAVFRKRDYSGVIRPGAAGRDGARGISTNWHLGISGAVCARQIQRLPKWPTGLRRFAAATSCGFLFLSRFRGRRRSQTESRYADSRACLYVRELLTFRFGEAPRAAT